MKYQYSQELTVRNGFPVVVEFNVQGAERDVGLMESYVEDYEIKTRSGSGVSWLKLTDKEISKLIESLNWS